ncbi:MAG: hypothetical protein DMG16_04910 [Acidobacteria bacterium]|nr:MAG: hypothetical protein DMG16_04910 [Acidobacteriota bacterium]
MCGRVYETYTDEELYFRYLNKKPLSEFPFVTPIYNLCPTMNSPVLRLIDGERRFDPMQWQLIPNREPTFKTKLSTINAKSETVFESPLYRDLVVRQRCIVPLSGMPHSAYRLLCRGQDYAESIQTAKACAAPSLRRVQARVGWQTRPGMSLAHRLLLRFGHLN